MAQWIKHLPLLQKAQIQFLAPYCPPQPPVTELQLQRTCYSLVASTGIARMWYINIHVGKTLNTNSKNKSTKKVSTVRICGLEFATGC